MAFDDEDPGPRRSAVDAERDGADEPAPMQHDDESAGSAPQGSRVSVVDEQPPRPGPPPGASDDDYKWHTYKVYPSGRPDAA